MPMANSWRRASVRLSCLCAEWQRVESGGAGGYPPPGGEWESTHEQRRSTLRRELFKCSADSIQLRAGVKVRVGLFPRLPANKVTACSRWWTKRGRRHRVRSLGSKLDFGKGPASALNSWNFLGASLYWLPGHLQLLFHIAQGLAQRLTDLRAIVEHEDFLSHGFSVFCRTRRVARSLPGWIRFGGWVRGHCVGRSSGFCFGAR